MPASSKHPHLQEQLQLPESDYVQKAIDFSSVESAETADSKSAVALQAIEPFVLRIGFGFPVPSPVAPTTAR